jgi:hypothetical protein
MLNKQTLQTIQSGADAEVYFKATDVALYMATGGYIDAANQVLSELWKHGLPHDRNTWLPDIGFMVLWHASGKYPALIPFALDDIDPIEKNMRGYVAMDKWAYEMPDLSWQQLSGQDLLRNAFMAARLVKGDGHGYLPSTTLTDPASVGFSERMAKIEAYVARLTVQPSDELPAAPVELEALAMLQKMMTESFYATEGLLLGAELAARHGRRDTAIQFAKVWAEETVRQDRGCGLPPIATCRHVAPLLLEGVIAQELGLSDALVADHLPQLLEVLNRRLSSGRSLAFGQLSWSTLIRQISEQALRIEDDNTYDEQVRAAQWIGFAGADPEAIRLAEERLQASLPADYKLFLETTDGMRPFPLNNPALLPVAKIGYLKDMIEPYLFDIILEYHLIDGDPAATADNLSKAILICQYPDEQSVWLMPEDSERSTWQTWFYAPWMPGVCGYPSFRFYMEEQLIAMEGYGDIV